MKVIKKKNKNPLILAICAVVMAVLIAAAIVIPLLINKINANNPTQKVPYQLYDGEAYLNGDVETPIAYPRVDTNKLLAITLSGKNTDYALYRDDDETITREETDKDGNKFMNKVNESTFYLEYEDANGEAKRYYPDIAFRDPNFEYEDIYATVTAGGAGEIYRLTFLQSAITAMAFTDRMEFGEDIEAYRAELKRFGLMEDECLTIRFTYITENGGNAVHTIRVGDKVVSGAGYYFTVDNRPFIYTTSDGSISYAMTEFTGLIKPVLVAEGLPQDNAFEPYLVSDFKHYVNHVHTGGDDCKDSDCNGNCTAVVGSEDRVILESKITTPIVTPLPTNNPVPGYVTEDYKNIELDMTGNRNDKSFQKLISAVLGKSAGDFSENFIVTMYTYANSVSLDEKTGKSAEYTYKILSVEAIVSDTAGDIVTPGAAISANDLVKVSYTLTKDGKLASWETMHGVIDLKNASLPENVKNAIISAGIGDISGGVEFSIVYDKTNSIKRNVKMHISEIVAIVDEKGAYVDKIEQGTTTLYRFYYTLDGERIEGVETATFFYDDPNKLSEDDKLVEAVLKGKGVSSGLNLEVISYDEYEEIFADFICHSIKGISYFVKSEIVASFEFQQASERDPFIGESVYKNTLEDSNSMYALNSSVCELISKYLGGAGSDSSAGLWGSETVAVGLTPDIMKQYGLYAYTVYYELPRGIEAEQYDEDRESMEDYLNRMDDYTFLDTLGFTLYISEEQPDGTRFIASDLYDLVAKIDGESFIFLERSFTELYARRNLALVDVSDIKNVTFDFYLDEFSGTYSSELTHDKVYWYNGRAISPATYNQMVADYNALSDEEKRTAENPADVARAGDMIGVYTIISGENSGNYITKFSEFYENVTTPLIVNGKNYGVSLHAFYGNKSEEGDSVGTTNFKELLQLIYFTRYESILTPEEQALASSDNLLMRIKFELGERYLESDEVHSAEYKAGIMHSLKSYYNVLEFYRISDRRIMVKHYKEDILTGAVSASVSDFYISSFAFKKIASGYLQILDGGTVENNTAYPPVVLPSKKD